MHGPKVREYETSDKDKSNLRAKGWVRKSLRERKKRASVCECVCVVEFVDVWEWECERKGTRMCVNVREKEHEWVWVRGSLCERERFAATDLLFWITKLRFFQVLLRCRYARDFCLRNLIQPRCLPSSSSKYPRSKVTKGFLDYGIFSNLQSRLHTPAPTKLFLPYEAQEFKK